MSIIADTLNRLQSSSSSSTSKGSEGSPLPSSENPKERTQQIRTDSRLTFWTIGIALILGLGGLALSTFWIGWNLDFEVAPNSHARLTKNSPVPVPPLKTGSRNATSPAQDSPTSIPPDAQLPITPAHQTNPESSLQMEGATSKKPFSKETTPTNIPTSVPLRKSQPIPPTLREQTNQMVSIPSEKAVQTDKETAIDKKLNTEEPIKTSKESERLLSQKPPTYTDSEWALLKEWKLEEPITLSEESPSLIFEEEPIPNGVTIEEQIQEPKQSKLLATPLANEIITTEEILTSSPPPSTPPNSPVKIAALPKQPESSNLKKKRHRPSSTNQLRHAQQLIRSKKYEDAVTLLSPLFQEPPVTWQPWFWMGTALLGKGDMEQADQFLLSGLARNDKIPQLWIQRAIVAQQRGDYQLAIHELRQAESLEADLPHIHLNMGYAYEQLGNHRLANQYYGKFLKLSEGQPTFFAIRKKLFARISGQTSKVRPSPPSSKNP